MLHFKLYENEEVVRHRGSMGKVFLAFLESRHLKKLLTQETPIKISATPHPKCQNQVINLWITMANILIQWQ